MFRDDNDVYHQEPLADTTLFYRCAYLVTPRSVAFAMPYDWQVRFAMLMEEAREIESRFDVPWPTSYHIQARGDNGRLTRDPLRDYRCVHPEVAKLAKWSSEQPFHPEVWEKYHKARAEELRQVLEEVKRG